MKTNSNRSGDEFPGDGGEFSAGDVGQGGDDLLERTLQAMRQQPVPPAPEVSVREMWLRQSDAGTLSPSDDRTPGRSASRQTVWIAVALATAASLIFVWASLRGNWRDDNQANQNPTDGRVPPAFDPIPLGPLPSEPGSLEPAVNPMPVRSNVVMVDHPFEESLNDLGTQIRQLEAGLADLDRAAALLDVRDAAEKLVADFRPHSDSM